MLSLMSSLPPAADRPFRIQGTYFPPHAANVAGLDTAGVFSYIYANNVWGSDESVSGPGSADDATARLRAGIPPLLRDLGVRTLLDAPCGDFGWLSRTDLHGVRYIGLDIVPELVARNSRTFAKRNRRFLAGDLINDPLPGADAILCRDCLVHLSFDQIFAAFANMRASGARYLLSTTYVEIDANEDAATGDWRPLNLTLPPFGLPEPEALIVEGCEEGDGAYADKSLGLWRVADLPSR